jgi:hypothetical protein
MNFRPPILRRFLSLSLLTVGASLVAMMPVTHCNDCVIRQTYTSGAGTTWDGCGHRFTTEGAADQYVLLHCGD